MSPEETFRRVLAARLPAGPGWTAWIDGTVSELAASVPALDPGEIEAVIAEELVRSGMPGRPNGLAHVISARILALLQPVEAR